MLFVDNHRVSKTLINIYIRVFCTEGHFLLFKDQLVESGRQKTKENIILCRKFHLVENGPKFHLVENGPEKNSETY